MRVNDLVRPESIDSSAPLAHTDLSFRTFCEGDVQMNRMQELVGGSILTLLNTLCLLIVEWKILEASGINPYVLGVTE